SPYSPLFFFFFFFNAPPTTYFYTLSLHDALPIYFSGGRLHAHVAFLVEQHRVEVDESEILSLVTVALHLAIDGLDHIPGVAFVRDRKSTRLNSSHVAISYAVFCLKKKNKYYIRLR